MKLFDRIERYRRGASVKRYHTRRMLREQDVGAHSWGVAVLADLLWREAYGAPAPANLLLAALHHDLAEFDVGDLPPYAKREFPAMRTALAWAEWDVNERLGLAIPEGDPEEFALKVADHLEFLWQVRDEIRMGNADLTVVAVCGLDRAEQNAEEGLRAPVCWCLARVALEQVQALRIDLGLTEEAFANDPKLAAMRKGQGK